MIVTTFRRCARCELLFRAPTISEWESREFYQTEYDQGFTTEIPSEEMLAELLATEFKGSAKDYSGYVEFLRALKIKPGARILDFGCSWGYGTWQLQHAGYTVQGFEISKPRCAFARSRLGLDVVPLREQVQPPFDCFFSAHVLEHVPNVLEILELARSWLSKGGLFVAFTPNGSELNREVEPSAWHSRWGFVHPQLLDGRFCMRNLKNEPYLLGSRGVDLSHVAAWDQKSSVQLSITGDELVIVFKK
jgi:SAM-dependent methyltransferase